MPPTSMAVAGALLGLLAALGLLLMLTALRAPSGSGGSARKSRLAALVQASGVARLTPAGVVSACLLTAAACGLCALLVTAVPMVACLAAAVGAAAPVVMLGRRAGQRTRAMTASWPDAVDALVSGVRAGLSLAQALSDLGCRGPQVLRAPFTAFEADMRVSGSLPDSMDALQARLADPVADRVLTALRVAHEVGGTDLGVVLRTLSSMLREEQRLRGEIEARQSWTVNAARLAVAAPWATLAFLCTRPEAVAAYSSPTGGLILASAAAMSVLAYLLMRRIARLPREARLGS